MAKCLPRALRLHLEVEQKIMTLPGDNFTEQFEFIVNDYFHTLPQRQAEVNSLETKIRVLKSELMALQSLMRKATSFNSDFERLTDNIEQLANNIKEYL